MNDAEFKVYIAGLFDGRGTFNTGTGRAILLNIASSDVTLLERIQRVFGVGSVQANQWSCTSADDCYCFLNAIKDYCIIRQESIQVALSFYERVINKCGKVGDYQQARLSGEEHEIRQALLTQIGMLNKGTSRPSLKRSKPLYEDEE